MKNKSLLNVEISVEVAVNLPSPYIPERTLLAAILERATRDIGPTAGEYELKKALEWFTARNHTITADSFSFKSIIHHLNLGYKEVAELHEKIRIAKEREPKRKRGFNYY